MQKSLTVKKLKAYKDDFTNDVTNFKWQQPDHIF